MTPRFGPLGLPRPRLSASFLATPFLEGRPRGRLVCGSFGACAALTNVLLRFRV